MEKINELPEFYFSSAESLTDQEKERITSEMQKLSVELPVEQQSVSLERLSRVDYAISDTVIWLRNRLNIDAKKRIPTINRIKFFSKDDWLKIAEKYRQSPDSLGLNSEVNDILICEGDNEEEMFGVLSHELVHCFSRRSVRVQKREDNSGRDISLLLYGFRNLKNNAFNWFNEIMTETINIEIISSSKRKETTEILNNLTGYYKNGVVLLDMIFEKMAEKTGTPVSKIKNELYTAYFDGNVASLRIFKQVFGTETLKLLALLKDNEYPTTFLKSVIQKYFEIDVKEFEKRVDKLEKGEELLLSNGVRIKIKKYLADKIRNY